MTDYTTGKIYKVVCGETNKVYIGSTIGTLEHRLAKHKAPTNGCKSNDFINPTIHLIEDYSCNNKKELEIRERYYMENNICVNRNIPGRTKQEHSKQYRLDNAEKIREYSKQYNIDNAEKFREYGKQHRLNNAEKLKKRGKQYYRDNAEKKKQYRLDIAERLKQYRLDNAEKLNEKFNCECGGKYTHANKPRHLKTNKHKKYLENNI